MVPALLRFSNYVLSVCSRAWLVSFLLALRHESASGAAEHAVLRIRSGVVDLSQGLLAVLPRSRSEVFSLAMLEPLLRRGEATEDSLAAFLLIGD